MLQSILRSELLSSAPTKIVFAFCGALHAFTAGLAVTCFAKVFAMGFLGMARSDGAEHACEAHPATRVPLALLAVLCLGLGILPTYVIPALDRTAAPLAHASATAALVPPFFDEATRATEGIPTAFFAEFRDLGGEIGKGVLPGRGLVVLHRGGEHNPVVFAMSTFYMLLVFAAALMLSFFAFRLVTRGRAVTRAPVWDGGLRELWPSFTYTASGFSNPVRVVFQAMLHPAAIEDNTEAVAQHFRTAITRKYIETHVSDRVVLGPPVHVLRGAARIVRRMHVGHVNAYAAYVLLTLLLVLIVGMGFF